MNFMSFSSTTIVFAKDFWIFIAVLVPLTAATLGIWFLATHQEKKSKEKKAKHDTSEMKEDA